MKKPFLLLIFLTGCVPHYADYQPNLASQPKNQAKYESDRKDCLASSLKRSDNSMYSLSPDAFKTPREMTDECMAQKGYSVILK